MDIQSINDDIKTRQWVERIKGRRESGLSVRKWCKQNNICEQTYYCWLKKLYNVLIEVHPLR
ncbi:IS66 family insertion sequence element accessory protein TnpA [Catenibacterium mitsuokai]|uniref:IS66 family insertion sequence element accessory protein TnpA n=1 Tax=Catenibacterium mitsuokai TaxID=100886 RepID=UPI0039AEF037